MPERALIVMDKAQQARVVKRIIDMAGMPAGAHGLGYAFPLRVPEDGKAFRGSNGYDATCVRNCAAFPEKVGVPIPEPTGRMEHYMPELKNWIEADAPIDARGEEPAP